MSAAIAIDFGTSRTKLAYLDDTTGRPELMRLGQRDDPFIPSLFYLERDSERIFLGDDAEAMLEQDPAGIVEVLKRKLHEAYVRANRRRIAPQDLLGLLLAELRTRSGLEVARFRGQPAAAVHLTVPAIYGPAQERILRAAAEQAGFSEIVLVPEPVSAARAWLAQAHTTTPGVVVFDGGGGTIDWAYLRRDGTDFSLVPECPPGGDRVGGHDLDRELLARVEDRLDSGALADGHGHEQAALQAVRVLKERYCRGLPCQPVRIGTCAVRLTAAEIDDAFEARFIRHACEGLKGYLAQVRAVSGPDQPPVLLVGGSARIKGLREAISPRRSGHASRRCRSGADRPRLAFQILAQTFEHRENPLTHRQRWDKVIDQVRRGLRHSPGVARRTESATLARERNEKIMPTVRAVGAGETAGENAELKVATKFAFHIGRHALRVPVVLTGECEMGLHVC